MNNITLEQLYILIGKNVAKYRKDKGLSQLDLSLSMGYKSVSIVSRAEFTIIKYTSTLNLTQLFFQLQLLFYNGYISL
jgi:transcriptional regulator with XRE-family HTH domain